MLISMMVTLKLIAFHDGFFRHQFRMPLNLFLRIVESVKRYEDYLMLKRDYTGLLRFSSLINAQTDIRRLHMVHS